MEIGKVIIYINDDTYTGNIINIENPKLEGIRFIGNYYEPPEYKSCTFDSLTIECYDLQEEDISKITCVKVEYITEDLFDEEFDFPLELDWDTEDCFYDFYSGCVIFKAY